MKIPRASLTTIDDFLAQKRIAMVGISHEATDFSVALFKELRRRGYDVVPVNPNISEVSGVRCFARLQDVQPPVDGALLMISPKITEAVVGDCAEAGIHRIWMYRGFNQGAVSPKAIEFCQERGMQVVPGECPSCFCPMPTGDIESTASFARSPAASRDAEQPESGS